MFGELYTIYMVNSTKKSQNSTSQIPVKSDHGYSPKYTEHIFNKKMTFTISFVISHDSKSGNTPLLQIQGILKYHSVNITNSIFRNIFLVCKLWTWLSQTGRIFQFCQHSFSTRIKSSLIYIYIYIYIYVYMYIYICRLSIKILGIITHNSMIFLCVF